MCLIPCPRVHFFVTDFSKIQYGAQGFQIAKGSNHFNPPIHPLKSFLIQPSPILFIPTATTRSNEIALGPHWTET